MTNAAPRKSAENCGVADTVEPLSSSDDPKRKKAGRKRPASTFP